MCLSYKTAKVFRQVNRSCLYIDYGKNIMHMRAQVIAINKNLLGDNLAKLRLTDASCWVTEKT